jgi:hypothetical protein
MIVHNVVQGEADWFRVRLGKPTASEFHKIITPAKMALSKQSRSYAFRLAAEAILNRSLDSVEETSWMARGKELEPDAVRAYSFMTDRETQPVGFVTTDDGRFGCSPDRLVGDDGLLELKCPSPAVHLAYLIDGFGDDYKAQAQGQLFVTGRKWVERMSYSDEMPPFIVRSEADPVFQSALRKALMQFDDELQGMIERARESGMFAIRGEVRTPHEELAEQLENVGQGDML